MSNLPYGQWATGPAINPQDVALIAKSSERIAVALERIADVLKEGVVYVKDANRE